MTLTCVTNNASCNWVNLVQVSSVQFTPSAVNLPLGYNAQTSEISSGICMTRLKLRISSVSKFGHADLCPPYEPLSVYGSGPPPNVWFPEPTRVHTPRSTSIGSAVLQGSHARFPEDTHRQTTLNYNSRPHLMLCIAMRRSKPRNLQTDR